jgi:hypothetical protein
LTLEAYKDRLAQKEFEEINKSASNQDEKRSYLQEIINKGRVINDADTLITAPIYVNELIK